MITSTYIPRIEEMTDKDALAAVSGSQAYPLSCVNWAEYPYAPEVTFHVAHSDKAFAVFFKVKESHVRAVSLEANGPVWEDSCVEIFIANPAGEGYFNFETNCIGTSLAAKRRSKTDADMFGEEQMAQIRTVGSLPHEAIDSKAEGQEWTMLKIIPFSVLGIDKAPASLKGNFYKCGDCCEQAHFLSWSPIDLPTPNFHCPEFFGEITL